MDIGDPPSVAGGAAIPQSPQFNLWWINSSTLSSRYEIIKLLASVKGLKGNGVNLKFDFSLFIKQLIELFKYKQNNSLIEGLTFSVSLSSYSKEEFASSFSAIQSKLKAVSDSSENSEISDSESIDINQSIELFIQKVTSLPEYQLL
jgi:hypothetical protein